MNVKRGDVVYLNKVFPEEGHIQGGDRPYVVVSNDVGNANSTICMIVPLTRAKRKRLLPTHTFVSHHHSLCLCEQIFTVSQNDVVRIVTRLPMCDMKNIDGCLGIALGFGW